MGKEIIEPIKTDCTEFTLSGFKQKDGSISALCGQCNNRQTVNANGELESEGCLGHRFKCLRSAIVEKLKNK